jgi:hypothetical protein
LIESTLTPEQRQSLHILGLRKRITLSGGWFYWVAGLSVANTIMMFAHLNMRMLFGLGATQIVDEIIQKFGGYAVAIGLPINLVFAAIYAALGYFACRRMRWAFITGMVLYTLDALLFLLS